LNEESDDDEVGSDVIKSISEFISKWK
jgi:hypothetical protein